ALVIRTADWSESSRIATLWTREFGKVRVLAKGGRRLKSSFEIALDLLTVCSIVFLRKSSGTLDLLTEAQVSQRFGRLATDLPALYGGYYLAELLSDLTQDYDPHPLLFDEALVTLASLGDETVPVGVRIARFEMVLLRELGYALALEACANCAKKVAPTHLVVSAAAGGVVCTSCQSRHRDKRPLSRATWELLRALESGESGQPAAARATTDVRGETRQLLNEYVTYLLGRRPRLVPYLGG